MIKLEIKLAEEVEVEKYGEEDYDDMLNDAGDVTVGGCTFNPSDILRNCDHTAYSCGFNDFQEYETFFRCPICGEDHEDEDDATFCCQSRDIYECEFCGEIFDDEDDCIEHELDCCENPDRELDDKTMDKCRDENF